MLTKERNEMSLDLNARGVKAAAKFLEKKGYIIVQTNWSGKNGEIELIAKEPSDKFESISFCLTKYGIDKAVAERISKDIIETLFNKQQGEFSNTLCFIKVRTYIENEKFSENKISNSDRAKLEMIAFEYLKENDIAETQVRFDEVVLLAMEGSRALLRHHVNILGID